jgi:hypothetical protein
MEALSSALRVGHQYGYIVASRLRRRGSQLQRLQASDTELAEQREKCMRVRELILVDPQASDVNLRVRLRPWLGEYARGVLGCPLIQAAVRSRQPVVRRRVGQIDLMYRAAVPAGELEAEAQTRSSRFTYG